MWRLLLIVMLGLCPPSSAIGLSAIQNLFNIKFENHNHFHVGDVQLFGGSNSQGMPSGLRGSVKEMTEPLHLYVRLLYKGRHLGGFEEEVVDRTNHSGFQNLILRRAQRHLAHRLLDLGNISLVSKGFLGVEQSGPQVNDLRDLANGTRMEVELQDRRPTGPAQTLGIDFGTTFFSAAYIDSQGNCRLLEDEMGNVRQPSTVTFHRDDEEIQVGVHLPSSPGLAQVSQVKRLLGRDFEHTAVKRLAKQWHGNGAEGWSAGRDVRLVDSGGMPTIQVWNHSYTPHAIEAMLLEKVKDDWRSNVGERSLSGVVLSIPPSFDLSQKQETLAGAEIADLPVLKVLSEPLLATYYHAEVNKDVDFEQHVLATVDFGGGTLDGTVMRKKGGKWEILVHQGDPELGGTDFTDCLFNSLILPRMEEQIGERLKAPQQKQLYTKTEDAKLALSKAMMTTVNLDGSHSIVLRRHIFEDKCRHLFDRAEEALKDLRRAAEKEGVKVSYLLMVGGASLMPKARKIAKSVFQMEPLVQDSLKAVACGAALVAQQLHLGLDPMPPQDVMPYTVGFPCKMNGVLDRMCRVIYKGESVPRVGSRMFSTSRDDQETVASHLYAGEGDMVAQNHLVREFYFRGLPARPAGEIKFETTMGISAKGLLSVQVRAIIPVHEDMFASTEAFVNVLPHQLNASSFERLKGEHAVEAVHQQRLRALRNEVENRKHEVASVASSRAVRCSSRVIQTQREWIQLLEDFLNGKERGDQKKTTLEMALHELEQGSQHLRSCRKSDEL